MAWSLVKKIINLLGFNSYFNINATCNSQGGMEKLRGYRQRLSHDDMVTWLFLIFFFGLVTVYRFNQQVLQQSPSSKFRNLKAEKWIIVAATKLSTDDVQKWTNCTGWKLVVVCDEITPGEWSSQHVIFIDKMVHASLNYTIHKSLPLNSYTRLVAGYIFAIEHGARAIYIADKQLALDSFIRVSYLAKSNWGLVYSVNMKNSPSLFNIREHFGCYSRRKLDTTTNFYSLCQTKTALYVPALIAQDRSAAETGCDTSAPAVTLEYGSYLYITSAGSLFMESGFWAYLPVEDGNYDTIWDCIVQWLLWNTESRLSVYLSEVDIVPKSRSSAINDIINVLNQSKCESVCFVQCTLNVTQKIITTKLVDKGFFIVVENWFSILTRFNYSFPQIRLQSYSCTDYVRYNPLINTSKETAISSTRDVPVMNLNQSLSLYNQTCNRAPGFADHYKTFTSSLIPWKQFADVMLVITFNTPRYEVIPYLEVLYRRIFPYIVYCGPEMISAGDERVKQYNLFFITYSKLPSYRPLGGLNFECAIKVARMNFNVKGYFFISDDVLIFPLAMTNLQPRNVWFYTLQQLQAYDLRTRKSCKLGKCDIDASAWTHWRHSDRVANAIEAMHSTCGVASPLCDCTRKLELIFGHHMRVTSSLGDIFYIPQRFMNDFALIADVLLAKYVFLEIAIATALTCLTPAEEVQAINGTAVWDRSRYEPWSHFRSVNQSGQMFLHPVKWSGLTSSFEQIVKLFCETVMPMYYPLH